MIRKQFVFSLIFIFLLFVAVTFLLAQESGKINLKTAREIESYTARYSYFNINNISTIIYNDGRADIALNGSSGFEYPKGSGKAVFYQSGLLWGAEVDGQIRVGGTTYRTGLKPGRILPDGTADDPESESSRIYRVRPDYLTADLSIESAAENKSISEIQNQYGNDRKEWPAEWGAPYEDVDGNGKYNWEIDVPGVPGSDQTLWFVANDLDSNQTKYLYGSPPMGIETQVSVWGYRDVGPFGNVLFKKYKIINKSSNAFVNMHLAFWSDPDLGDASNDYTGCDTTLDLSFIYNALEHDEVYGYDIPAGGIKLLQGPIVNGDESDEALYDGRILRGKRNLPMTVFNHFT